MPTFAAALASTISVAPGDQLALFAATDTLTAPATSIVMAPCNSGAVSQVGITFAIQFATAPTAVVTIFGSNTYPLDSGPQNGQTLYVSTNKQQDAYTSFDRWAFYWAVLTSQSAGGAVSVIAHL